MKRRNFLLSLPLIGAAVKALPNKPDVYDGSKLNPYSIDEVGMLPQGDSGKVLVNNGKAAEWLKAHPMNKDNMKGAFDEFVVYGRTKIHIP